MKLSTAEFMPSQTHTSTSRSLRVANKLVAIIVFALSIAIPSRGFAAVNTLSSPSSLELSPNVQSSISAVIGKGDSAYRVGRRNGGFEAANLRHHLNVEFTPQGVGLHSGTAQVQLAFEGYGYGNDIQQLNHVMPRANYNHVEYRRGPVKEWYENGPLGLEQGFTIYKAPHPGHGFLTLLLTVRGDLTAIADQSTTSVTLRDPNGNSRLRYSGLSAYDSTGRTLPVQIEMTSTGLLLKVDDSWAHYPLLVDPFVQLAELSASNGTKYADFGYAVAVSGTTVVVGAPSMPVGGNPGQGEVYVFVQPASGWANMTETARLTTSDGAAGDNFGTSVSVSGGTIAVAAPGAKSTSGRGAVYVFVKPGGAWTTMTQNAKLTTSDGAAVVSASISGSTVIAGAPTANGKVSQQGVAYLYVKPTNGWKDLTETAKLTASDGAFDDRFGLSVSISGTTAVVGAPSARVSTHPLQGAAYVFVQPAAGWTTMSQTAKLTAAGGLAGDDFGAAVAISGNILVVGASQRDSIRLPGAAYVFLKPTSGWASTAQFKAKLTASDGFQYNYFGSAVAIDGPNNTIVVGAPGAAIGSNIQQGAAYVFLKPSAGWQTTSTFNSKLVSGDGGSGDDLGHSVGVSGSNLILGAPYHLRGSNVAQGGTYIF